MAAGGGVGVGVGVGLGVGLGSGVGVGVPSGVGVAVGSGVGVGVGPAVVNEEAKSVTISFGGSMRSASVTSFTAISTEHVASNGRSASGSNVQVVGPPDLVPLTGWPAHVTSTAPDDRSTGSSNATTTDESKGTSIAPFNGVTAWTDGAASVTTMSSIPTHSSLPTAFAVMTRTWTSG
jgi:hypothetical protein